MEVRARHDGFCDSLAMTSRGHDEVWMIMDQLTKSTHFLAVWMTFTLEEFYRLYIREIVRLHGVPVSIVFDRDPDRPKTWCLKCTPMCGSARVAPSNIVYQWYGYRSTGTGVLNTKMLLFR